MSSPSEPRDASVPAKNSLPSKTEPHQVALQSSQTSPPPTRRERRRIGAEIWIVLGLSLGQSAVYAIISLIADLTAPEPLKNQTVTLNASQSPREYLDLTYQLVGIAFALVPVLLALYLLSARGRPALRSLGVDGTRPGRDAAWGFGLAAAIGIPGLAFFVLCRAVGINLEVQASALNAYWWTIPVLILSAFQNGVLEEVVVVGYLYERTHDMGWGRAKFMAASSVLRGSYHLYQGIGPFFGNMAMGIVFSWFYTSKWGRRRVVPLVIAHTILDIVSFVGYQYLPADWKAALGL